MNKQSRYLRSVLYLAVKHGQQNASDRARMRDIAMFWLLCQEYRLRSRRRFWQALAVARLRARLATASFKSEYQKLIEASGNWHREANSSLIVGTLQPCIL